MLAWLVGNVDVPAAAVLIGIGAGITAVAITALNRKRKIDYDLERAKMIEDYKLQTAKLDQKLITSHRSDD